MTTLIDALNVRAIYAYERKDVSVLPGLRSLGAAMALHGIAVNGGLVGGGIENIFFNENMPSVDDAVAGFRWLGLPDVAALVLRARDEYLRFRPTGWEDLSDEDSAVERARLGVLRDRHPGRLEAAVAARLDEIAPDLLPS